MNGAKFSGNVWAVGTEYILKTGDREKLVKNLNVSRTLHKQGFTSSIPIPTKTGSEYLDGNEIFILTQGIKGNPLPSPTDLEIIAKSSVKNTVEASYGCIRR